MDKSKTICKFCNNEFSIIQYRKHLKNKHNDKFDSLFNLTLYFLEIKYGIDEKILLEIINEYKISSCLHIENKYNILFRQYIDDLGLEPKTISESLKTEITKNKKINKFIEIYGVDNPSKSEKIKNKKKETFLKNYGVDNIWKLKEYRIWWENFTKEKYGSCCLATLHGNENFFGWKTETELNKEKRIKKMLDGFNNWYVNLNEVDKIEFNKKRSIKIINIKRSSLEKRIEEILFTNNIFYKSQYWIDKRSYDFYLGNNIILEVNGTYWHCDQRFYKKDDIIKRGEENYTVSDIWEKDNIKRKNVESYNYKMYYIWEYDMKNMSDDEILNFINNIIENENNKNHKNKE